MKMTRKDWISLGVALAIPQLAGGLGAIATAKSMPTWYRTLRKPSWNPPSQLFAPVWTTLYLMMGIASWLVWQRPEGERSVGWRSEDEPLALPADPEQRQALGLYGAQLGLNTLWSLIFFGLHSLRGALAEIGLLWALILATVVRFYRIRPLAGLLLVPYLAWTTFATALNATLVRLNR